MRARAVAMSSALALAVALAGCAAGPATGPRATLPAPPESTLVPAPIAGPAQAWRWDAPPLASVGMPAADADSVVATFGHVGVVLLGHDGRERWRSTSVGVRDVAPLLTADLVVASTESGMVAFDRRTGEPRWEVELGDRPNTPVAAGGMAVASTWGGSVIAVDLAGGRELWRRQLPGAALGPVATDGNVAAVTWEAEGGDAAGIAAFDGRTGRPTWSAPLPPEGVSSPALVADRLVVVAGDGSALALDAATGAVAWRTAVGGAGSPEVPPLPVGDQVVVAHRLGGLAVLDSRSGRLEWQAGTGSAAVRGGPGGPLPSGRHALPLDDGRLMVAGPGGGEILDPPGMVSGIVTVGRGVLIVAIAGADQNRLYAISGL
ncbi:MAG: PQQ-binding-like beta-propeller repeat protein [Acidimicrobiales bacterium]